MTAQRELLSPAGSQPIETSEDAADSLSPDFLSARRRAVLNFFAWKGDSGATADEIAALWGKTHNSVAPRITELAEVGLVARALQKRRTRSGRFAFVYQITARGRDFLKP